MTATARAPRSPNGTRVARTCGYCSESFEVVPSIIRQGRGHYCSPECSRAMTLPLGNIHREPPARPAPAGHVALKVVRLSDPRSRWPKHQDGCLLSLDQHYLSCATHGVDLAEVRP